jgi:glycosyltransferase involved in cell wall biosynthesis
MSQAAPLFSVVTPTFNCAAKIDATIHSVLSQDKSLLEYWIIDGGSTDGTVGRLRTNDSRIQWISEPDKGIYDAMNKGIALAKGEYLYFLGAGDRLTPRILTVVENAIRSISSKRLPFLYGNVRWLSNSIEKYDGIFTTAKLTRRNICHQAIFYHRDIFTGFGGYELKYKLLADWAFNMRCFGSKDIFPLYMDYIIANFEGHGASSALVDECFVKDFPFLVLTRLGPYRAFRNWFDSRLNFYYRRILSKL